MSVLHGREACEREVVEWKLPGWRHHGLDGLSSGHCRRQHGAARAEEFPLAGAQPLTRSCSASPTTARPYTFVVPKPCGNIGIMPTPPDPAITKTPDGGTFTAGSPVTFTIAVTNAAPNGAQPANNVRVVDTAGCWRFAWATATSTRGTCNCQATATSLA